MQSTVVVSHGHAAEDGRFLSTPSGEFDFYLLADGANPEHQHVPAPVYEEFSQITAASTNSSNGLVLLSASSNSSKLIPWIPNPTVNVTAPPCHQVYSCYTPYGRTMLLYNVTEAGNYNITITGTSESELHYAHIYVLATRPVGDFTVSSSVTQLVIHPGMNTTVPVLLTGRDGFSGNVFLNPTFVCPFHTPLPCLVNGEIFQPSVSADPATVILAVNGTGKSLLRIRAPDYCCGFGTYILMVDAYGDFRDRSFNITVTNSAFPDFNISTNPASIAVLPGGSGSSTLTLTSYNNFEHAVYLNSYSPLVSFSSATLTLRRNATITSTLTLRIPTTTLPGRYNITIFATIGRYEPEYNHTLQVTLVVSPLATSTRTTILGMNPIQLYGLAALTTAIIVGAVGWVALRRKSSNIRKPARFYP